MLICGIVSSDSHDVAGTLLIVKQSTHLVKLQVWERLTLSSLTDVVRQLSTGMDFNLWLSLDMTHGNDSSHD